MMTEATEATSAAMERMEIEEGSTATAAAAATMAEETPTDILNQTTTDADASRDEKGDDDDDSSTTTTLKSDDDEAVAPDKAEELLIQATALKEEGNSHFAESKLDQAARCYRRGCNNLKSLNKHNTGDAQVQALLTALQTNLSMVLCKQKKFRPSVDVASKVLERDPVHVKALFRRAVALRQLGELDRARNDLKTALTADPNNTACKKELASIKQECEQIKAVQKKNLAKAFRSNSSLLYHDKEAAEKRKAEEEERKRREKQELYKKRKQQWEDECVSRMARDEPAISFDEWEKEQKQAEKAKRKEEEKCKQEEEKRRKEEEKRRKEERRKQREAEQGDDDDSEMEDLTEQELASMRGYKKTKDGRTTSYFTREAEVKIDAAPKRLEEVSNTAPTRLVHSYSSSSNGPSAWNQAGTWEEKDTTSWCTAQLRKRLEETSITTEQLDVDIVTVEELTGHASVALAAGKKRFIFEYESRLKFEMKAADEVIASGVVRLPDVCSTHHDELEVTFDAWSKLPSAAWEVQATETRQRLAEELRLQVQTWVQDFNQAY